MVLLLRRGRLRKYLCATLWCLTTIVALLVIFPEYNPLPPAKKKALVGKLQSRAKPHVSKLVTVIFRQFEEFENDVADSVQSFVSAYPNMPILVLCEMQPYPPFSFSYANDTLKNVQIVSSELKLDASPGNYNHLGLIQTEYVLFVPDSTRVLRRTIQRAIVIATANPGLAIAMGIGNSHTICQKVKWDYTNWTLMYSKDGSGAVCDAVHGSHALLIKTSLLHLLPQPFVLPFPEAFYLQTTTREIMIKIIENKLGAGRAVLKSPAAKQRAFKLAREHRLDLYKRLGVKAVVREGKVQWFGCRKDTPRCFPSVQGTPSYLYEKRNTPPCCRRNLRRVAAHVLRILAEVGARCWLETTSLLGAIINKDLLPWAEYVEIGIHVGDLSRLPFLQHGGVDPEGFVWERATKGHYYTVAYSQTNRIYVLLLPFVAKNGTMKPADWVLAHQKEFPERHMHPLAQIQFAGRPAPAPNDARSFLDRKLGQNSVERCHKLGPRLLYDHV